MSACAEIEWSAAYLTPAPIDRVEPGTSDWFEGDLSDDVDCQGDGVTLLTAAPTIRAEDDDGLLTFGTVQISGLTFRIPFTVDPTQTQAMYAIDVELTTSDGRTLHRWHTLPVVPTQIPHA